MYPQAVGTTTFGTAMPQQAYGTVAPAAANYVQAGAPQQVMTAAAPQQIMTMAAPQQVVAAAAPQQVMAAPQQMMPAPAQVSPITSPRATFGTASYAPGGQQMVQAPRGGSLQFAPGGGSLTVAPAGVPRWNNAPQSPGPSYVPSPQVPMWQNAPAVGGGIPGWGSAPAAPQQQQPPTTEGIPNPQQITVQQAQYEKALDRQLAEGLATLEKEREIEKKMLKFSADKEIALVSNQVMERLIEQLALVDEKAVIAELELKKAAVERKLQLSAQAMNLTLDYEQKFLQVEWTTKRNEFEAKLSRENSKLQEQINKIEAAAERGNAYAPGGQAVSVAGHGFAGMALPSTGAPQGFEGGFQMIPA